MVFKTSGSTDRQDPCGGKGSYSDDILIDDRLKENSIREAWLPDGHTISSTGALWLLTRATQLYRDRGMVNYFAAKGNIRL
jgi:hypothetical protein